MRWERKLQRTYLAAENSDELNVLVVAADVSADFAVRACEGKPWLHESVLMLAYVMGGMAYIIAERGWLKVWARAFFASSTNTR